MEQTAAGDLGRGGRFVFRRGGCKQHDKPTVLMWKRERERESVVRRRSKVFALFLLKKNSVVFYPKCCVFTGTDCTPK